MTATEIPSRAAFVKAIEQDRLFIKTRKGWFLARETHWTLFDAERWCLHFRAGPRGKRSIITNIDHNVEGRQFLIAPERTP